MAAERGKAEASASAQDVRAFLDRILAACGQRVDDLDAPIDELRGLTLDDLAGNPDAVLREPGVRVRFMLLAAKHRPTAERKHIGGVDVLDTRSWPEEPAARARFLEAFQHEVAELRRSIAPPPPEADEWLPVSEAAQRAGLTTETVRGWVRRSGNALRRKTIGGIAHVRLEDVLAERDMKAVANPKRRGAHRLPPLAPKLEKRDARRSRRP